MKFYRSLLYALAGIRIALRNECNVQIQIVIALVALLLGAALRLSTTEWTIVILCIAMVIGLEMMNTALEKLCNLVEPDYNPTIKVIKDIAAGAVLLAALASIVIGALLYLPKIFALF